MGGIVATQAGTDLDLHVVNAQLAAQPAQAIVRWAADTFGAGLVMSSSFGMQAAVMLHLVTQVVPDVPVIFVDTGYLFPETYRFAEELRQRLNLNLKVVQPELSAARMEALHGRLWEEDTKEALDRYDQWRKVEPMQRALSELHATAWLSGVRRDQTEHRGSMRVVDFQNALYHVHPILSWSSKDVHEYLKRHDLPYHPLVEKGYASIGDVHSTLPIMADQHERAGRFRGLKQECGLHLPATRAEDQSRESSDL